MSALDTLTNAVTAFRTFAELLASGYTPTIYQTTRRKRLLTRVLAASGRRVYIGNGKFVG